MARKSLLVTVVAAAVFLIATPKVIGIGIRDNTVNNLLALLPPESRNQFQIEETEFSNGWFSSQVALEVRYEALGMDEFLLRLDFDISHGPILRTENGFAVGLAYASITPSLEESLQQELQELPFTLPPVSIELYSRFDQSLHVTLDIASLEYDEGDRHLSFGGMNGMLLAQADRSARLSLDMNSMEASDSGTGVGYSLGGFSVSSNTEDMSNILASSAAVLSINELSSTGVAEISVGELQVNSRLQPATQNPGKIDMLQQLSITDVTGEIPLSSLSWESDLLGLESEIFRRYAALTSGLQNQAAVNTQAAQLIQEIGLLLIQNPLTFNNQVDVMAYDGDHAIVLDMNWAGLPDVDNLGNLDTNAMLDALEINLDVSLHLDAVMRSPAADMVDPDVQEGYIVVDNGRIRAQATLSGGELTLNGEAVPLDQFL